MPRVLPSAFALSLAFSFSGDLAAQLYDVSQFDPVAGSFVPLGSIEAYATDQSHSDYYNFTGSNPSFTDPAPELTSNRSHLFVVASSVDGLGVAFVHDERDDALGGSAETRWTVLGDPDGAAWLVQDGPPSQDQYTGSAGDTVFTASHGWPAENSDGGIVGTLDGAWTVETVFTDVPGTGAVIHNLDDWFAFSADGSSFELVLEEDRPVRIAPADCPSAPSAQVPRAGSPPNPSAFLPGDTTTPAVGAVWDPLVDHTTFVPGAVADFVVVTGGPLNLDLGAPGTLLCDVTSPLLLFETAPAPGAPFALPIPANCPLVGVQVCAQGGSIDAALQPHLANALDVTIGTF